MKPSDEGPGWLRDATERPIRTVEVRLVSQYNNRIKEVAPVGIASNVSEAAVTVRE